MSDNSNRKYIISYKGFQLFSAPGLHELSELDELLDRLLGGYSCEVSGEHLIRHTTQCLVSGKVINQELADYVIYVALDGDIEVPVFDLILEYLKEWLR